MVLRKLFRSNSNVKTPNYLESLKGRWVMPDKSELEAMVREEFNVGTKQYLTSGEEQVLNGFITQPLAGKEKYDDSLAIIRFMPWSDEPHRIQNDVIDKVLADIFGVSVIIVRTPGVDSRRQGKGPKSTRATPNQKRDLDKGEFRSVGDAISDGLDTLREQGKIGANTKFVVQASSGAVDIAAGFIGSTRRKDLGVDVAAMVLDEGVSYEGKRRLASLALRFLTSPTRKSLESNSETPPEEGVRRWLGRVALAASGNWQIAKAIAEGRFEDNFGAPSDNAAILMRSGSRSKLSDRMANEIMAGRIGANYKLLHGVSHAVTLSLPAMIDGLTQAFGRLENEHEYDV